LFSVIPRPSDGATVFLHNKKMANVIFIFKHRLYVKSFTTFINTTKVY